MTETLYGCDYGVLVRVVQPHTRNKSPRTLQIPGDDLLIAFSCHHMRLFKRDTKSISCSCYQVNATNQFLALGFHCPHFTSYQDYWQMSTIPFACITQVLMTYQSTNTGIATRTKDLIMVFTDHHQLHLEFEHNLSRGSFLEALTAATASVTSRSQPFEVDYMDLDEHVENSHTTMNWSLFPSRPLTFWGLGDPIKEEINEEKRACFIFQRDALRHVMYEKIKLSLQLSNESSIEDIHCTLLVETAIEMAMGLDEPDLHTLALLTSGFIHMQCTSSHKKMIAIDQVQSSLALAKENSLPYLTCLALHCIADLYVQQNQLVDAKQLLIEAAKLMSSSEAMDPAMKMHIHYKIHYVQELIQHASTSKRSGETVRRRWTTFLSSPTKKEPMINTKSKSAFNLWNYSLGTSSTSTGNEVGCSLPMKMMLDKVPKALDGLTRSCFVDVLGIHGTKKARFRVFYEPDSTFLWLQEHIRIRYQVVHHSSSQDETIVELFRIELWYDPQRKTLIHDLETRLSEWIVKPDDAIHAKLGLTVHSTHRTSSDQISVGPIAVVETSESSAKEISINDSVGPTVMCSLCNLRIALDDVELHSEKCF